MKSEIELNQKKVNKRSGRKCADYEELEKKYQDAQNHWEQYQDKPSWDIMFTLIHLAVFNNLNKKLEHILAKDEIEGRSLDVTMNIIQALLNKKSRGENWKINKVSSCVFLPCLAIYSKKLQFEDKVLGEDAFTVMDDEGNRAVMEFEDSYVERGTGIYHLHGGNIR